MNATEAGSILDALGTAQEAKDTAINAHPDLVARKLQLTAELAQVDSDLALIAKPYLEVIAGIENRLRATVLELGVSISNDRLQAVYTKGRISWDTRALDGYAAGHPEIVQFRKQGEPSVSIRARQ